MEYRKKPVVVEAFQFDGTVECLKKNVSKDYWENFAVGYEGTEYGYSAIEFFNLNENLPKKEPYEFHIHTLEGPHKVSNGDFIIKGVHGEYYPCKPDIFEETYEETDNNKLVRLRDSDWESITFLMLDEADKLEEIKNMNADNLATFMREKVELIDNQLKLQDKE